MVRQGNLARLVHWYDERPSPATPWKTTFQGSRARCLLHDTVLSSLRHPVRLGAVTDHHTLDMTIVTQLGIHVVAKRARNSQYLWMGSRRPSFDPAL
jgi:hypothetical protein